MRLDKFLSNFSGLSRKEAKQAIKNGDVIVDGKAINNPQYNVNADTQIRLSGMHIQPAGPRYFMMNKPPGYVCANSDSQHPTVISLLFEDDIESLHIAGRLDIDTTGLVLITDDGQWNHRITSPKHKLKKRYIVTVDEPLAESSKLVFMEGVLLKSEKKRTRPAELIIQDAHHAELIIQEGKYHQVKRMFTATNNHVTQLHRAQIGEIVLDQNLAPGEYRPLTDIEIQSVVMP